MTREKLEQQQRPRTAKNKQIKLKKTKRNTDQPDNLLQEETSRKPGILIGMGKLGEESESSLWILYGFLCGRQVQIVTRVFHRTSKSTT